MSNHDPYAPTSAVENAAEPEVEETEALEVPEGSAAVVLEWVDGDKERAKAALEAEKSGNKRKTLIKELEGIVE